MDPTASNDNLTTGDKNQPTSGSSGLDLSSSNLGTSTNNGINPANIGSIPSDGNLVGADQNNNDSPSTVNGPQASIPSGNDMSTDTHGEVIQPGHFVVADGSTNANQGTAGLLDDPPSQTDPAATVPLAPTQPDNSSHLAQLITNQTQNTQSEVNQNPPESNRAAGDAPPAAPSQPDPTPFVPPPAGGVTPPSVGGSSSKSKMIKIILIVLVLVIVVVSAAAAWYFLIKGKGATQESQSDSSQLQVEESSPPPKRIEGGFADLPESASESTQPALESPENIID